ncbi:hypothetical protein MY4038_008573 [Beauveria bassiana]
MDFGSLPITEQYEPERWSKWLQALQARPDMSELGLLRKEFLSIDWDLSPEEKIRAMLRYHVLKIKNEFAWVEFDCLYKLCKEQSSKLLKVRELIMKSVESTLMRRASDELPKTYTTRQLVKKLQELVALDEPLHQFFEPLPTVQQMKAVLSATR